jgi:hypothetical protein
MARGLEGAEGAFQYSRHYAALVDRILRQLEMPVLTLEADITAKSDFVNRIANFIGLPACEPFPTRWPHAQAFVGTYKDTFSEDCYSVITDGSHLYVDGTPPTRLIQRGLSDFELLGTCVRFEFLAHADGSVYKLACRGNLKGLEPEWARV